MVSEMKNGSGRRFAHALLVLIVFFGLATVCYGLQQLPVIETVGVGEPAGLSTGGITIVQLSDLHVTGRADVWRLRYALRLIERTDPDLIVLTGDFVRGSAAGIDLALPVLRTLEAPLGVYAVLGNHDLWSDREAVARGLAEAGIDLLVNRGLAIEQGEARFYLAGLDDAWSGRPDLDAATAGNTGHLPVVVLLHEPDLGQEILRSGRAWLLLSGHSHGGQVRLPGIGAIILPEHGREYDQGLYGVGEGWLYVNRGLGTAAIPVRLGCRPEVTVLEVYPPQVLKVRAP
ncbi:MAG: metallophosphoesterase [Chloroflexi bacterium]|nr:metallophosphoesterase [Chloroflexota bacterium]